MCLKSQCKCRHGTKYFLGKQCGLANRPFVQTYQSEYDACSKVQICSSFCHFGSHIQHVLLEKSQTISNGITNEQHWTAVRTSTTANHSIEQDGIDVACLHAHCRFLVSRTWCLWCWRKGSSGVNCWNPLDLVPATHSHNSHESF